MWLFVIVAASLCATVPCAGQSLEPRAFSTSPVEFNIVVTGFGHNWGDLSLDPNAPITDADADISTAFVGFVHTLDVAGRTANLGMILPYVSGDVSGIYLGEHQQVSRSGLGDPRFRFAINLYGGPAMTAQEFAGYKPKWNVGASLVVSAPFGRYLPDKIINIGANRWAFKPEIGISRALGRWTFEFSTGMWFFTDNTDFAGGRTRSQEPIGSVQFHVIYTIGPRMWIAYNANYYRGGRTSFGEVKNLDLQNNSRMGLTFAMPVTRAQSLKLSYSRGAYTSIGANFDSLTFAWQLVWPSH